MRVAFGDLPGIESIQTLAALERAKERGVGVELIILNDEDLAAQAIVSGQADVGIGAPYTLVQKAGVPIRMFAQISTLRFFPVVNSESYKTWKDLDGQEIAVQARGSGTEAVMLLMAKKHGIAYGNVSYVPGSEVRRNALIQGTIKASIVDAANRRALETEAPGKFIVLPVEDLKATDEAVFATADYLKNNQADVDILVEELINTAREITANPAVAVEFRNKYKLLPDLGAEADAEITAYYKEVAEAGSLPLNGGGADAVADDFSFFSLAGQVEGDPASLKVEDFWDLSAVDRTVGKLGAK
ncbi:MAG TPA: ABC transporter substrate-binding protein [Aestuariivirgaceae bacterium]|nr:ABC transporter substrate-binding protein [Aestuariivirgaceae bacterium]